MNHIRLVPGVGSIGLKEQTFQDSTLLQQVIKYLNDAQVVLSARGVVPDKFSDEATPIPILFHCDGEFIWSGEFTAYVKRYDWSIPKALLDRIIMLDGEPLKLSDSQVTEALSLIRTTG